MKLIHSEKEKATISNPIQFQFPSRGGVAFSDSRMTGWFLHQTKKGNPFGLPLKLNSKLTIVLI